MDRGFEVYHNFLVGFAPIFFVLGKTQAALNTGIINQYIYFRKLRFNFMKQSYSICFLTNIAL